MNSLGGMSMSPFSRSSSLSPASNMDNSVPTGTYIGPSGDSITIKNSTEGSFKETSSSTSQNFSYTMRRHGGGIMLSVTGLTRTSGNNWMMYVPSNRTIRRRGMMYTLQTNSPSPSLSRSPGLSPSPSPMLSMSPLSSRPPSPSPSRSPTNYDVPLGTYYIPDRSKSITLINSTQGSFKQSSSAAPQDFTYTTGPGTIGMTGKIMITTSLPRTLNNNWFLYSRVDKTIQQAGYGPFYILQGENEISSPTSNVSSSSVAYPPSAMSTTPQTINGITYTASVSTVTFGTAEHIYDRNSTRTWVITQKAYDVNSGAYQGGTSSTQGIRGEFTTLQMSTPVVIDRCDVSYAAVHYSRAPRIVYIFGSNNGTNWTELYRESGLTWSTNKKTFNFTNSTAYSYYRFLVKAIQPNNTEGSLLISDITYYGK